MQANEGAAALVMEQPEVDTEATVEATQGAVMLPVHLPNAGGEVAPDGTHAARSDEVWGLLASIRRLESIIEEETVALATGKKIDFDDFSARKSRSMLEFVRLMRARMHLGAEAEITAEIQRLRQKLERNRAILEMHYDAVREVASIIVRAVKEAESDGTYSGRAVQDGR
ncbi:MULTISPECIES: flagellar biosynthesis protein FlgN [unclassified Bradyrhizobium]|uniref:flagellar biosynthesis protein FlgN n=1 Tax=unclassified Bradyrhizobium TaxID=2631580 RepID=UPI001FF7EDF2|nr:MULTISPECIES: flagellar biosynthesis protein FlgN [unclassified Bradyrhizobium]MCK1714859.1 flagellar biosynthesis protein FlgN [Bradyrhizobium sp. 143]MCK1728417.1 flagellar biosynthesis protein FlgN [Bradyrhizobium sp. 142]